MRAATDSPEAADTIQIPNPANVAVFRCSKFESCKARPRCSRHDNLTVFRRLHIDGAIQALKLWYRSDIYRGTLLILHHGCYRNGLFRVCSYLMREADGALPY